MTVTIGDTDEQGSKFIISNTQLANYRATSARLNVSEDNDNVTISPELAHGLMVQDGEQIRVLAM